MAVAPIRASDVLTITGAILNAETVTVGGSIYGFFNNPNGVTTGEVKRGATVRETLENLKAAINGGPGSGTIYGSATPVNAAVRATTVTDTTLTVVAIVPGTVGNAIAASETLTNGAWATANLTGGGGGSITDWVDDIIATSQINADVLTDLKQISTP